MRARLDGQGYDRPAIEGILEEAQEIAGDIADQYVLDAAIIAAAQAVEHDEIPSAPEGTWLRAAGFSWRCRCRHGDTI